MRRQSPATGQRRGRGRLRGEHVRVRDRGLFSPSALILSFPLPRLARRPTSSRPRRRPQPTLFTFPTILHGLRPQIHGLLLLRRPPKRRCPQHRLPRWSSAPRPPTSRIYILLLRRQELPRRRIRRPTWSRVQPELVLRCWAHRAGQRRRGGGSGVGCLRRLQQRRPQVLVCLWDGGYWVRLLGLVVVWRCDWLILQKLSSSAFAHTIQPADCWVSWLDIAVIYNCSHTTIGLRSNPRRLLPANSSQEVSRW